MQGQSIRFLTPPPLEYKVGPIPVEVACPFKGIPIVKSHMLNVRVKQADQEHDRVSVLCLGSKRYARILAAFENTGAFKGKNVGFTLQAEQARKNRMEDSYHTHFNRLEAK